MRRTIRVVAVAALTLAACSGSESSSPVSPATTNGTPSVAATTSTPAPPASSAPDTTDAPHRSPLQSSRDGGLTGTAKELADLRGANEGRLPLDASLDLFAATLGPVPGGEATRFPAAEVEGSLAVRALLGRWDELTPEQQSAVRVALGYSATQSIKGTSQVPSPELLARVDAARAEIASHMGADLSIPITVEELADLGTVDTAAGRRPVAGLAWPEQAGSPATAGRPDRCRVRLAPGSSDETIAHEVFHCFQFDLAADIGDVARSEDWIVEGSAEWAGVTVAGIDPGAAGWFEDWAVNNDSIFALDYAACGFFWSIEDMGVSPWQVVPAMLGQSGLAAVSATGLDPAQVLTHIATAVVRARTMEPIPLSATWDFSIPVPEAGERTPFTVTAANPAETDFEVGAFTKGFNLMATVVGGERVQVSMKSDVGTLEFFGKEPITWSSSFGREFCLDEGGCRCGAGDSVESGLEVGGRDVAVSPGAVTAGELAYSVKIPADAFTDGRWVGTITTSALTIDAEDASGLRAETVTPFELTVENGAVTSGAFAMGFDASFTTGGSTGEGTVTLTGTFLGCGFAPQMQGATYSFDGTMTIAGASRPFQIEQPIPAGAGRVDTVWIPDPVTDPNRRTGTIDAGGTLGAISAGGFATSGLEITFEATRSA